jgi:hypothetical protein
MLKFLFFPHNALYRIERGGKSYLVVSILIMLPAHGESVLLDKVRVRETPIRHQQLLVLSNVSYGLQDSIGLIADLIVKRQSYNIWCNLMSL